MSPFSINGWFFSSTILVHTFSRTYEIKLHNFSIEGTFLNNNLMRIRLTDMVHFYMSACNFYHGRNVTGGGGVGEGVGGGGTGRGERGKISCLRTTHQTETRQKQGHYFHNRMWSWDTLLVCCILDAFQAFFPSQQSNKTLWHASSSD